MLRIMCPHIDLCLHCTWSIEDGGLATLLVRICVAARRIANSKKECMRSNIEMISKAWQESSIAHYIGVLFILVSADTKFEPLIDVFISPVQNLFRRHTHNPNVTDQKYDLYILY
jgi:hypothetical protein